MSSLSSAFVIAFAVAAAPHLHALAEAPPHGELANETSSVEVGAQSFAASVPRWCGLLPGGVRPTRCSPPPPEAAPAVSAPLPARCGQLAAEERANITACNYSEEEAIQFGAIAAAAFCQTEGWTCGSACTTVPDMRDAKQVDNDACDAHAYVGRLGEACVLAFRGTDSLNGWAQDFASVVLRRFPRCSFEGKPCKVGYGFLQNYQSIARGIRRQLAVIGCTKSTPLFVTGHSLGAAMSALAIFDLNRRGYNIDKAYSFGQPRVGDRIFALAFNQAMAGKPVFRVTKADDPAVYVPPKGLFHHVGTEVYYKGDTSEGFKVCNGSGEDPDCQESNGDGNVPALLLKCAVLSKCGHLQYLQPRIAFPMDASRCSRKLQSSTFLFP